jgi:hypothetical protein
MSGAVVVLLERARKCRAAAEHARRLAKSVTDADAVDKLERYAEELERSARELEECGSALAETSAHTKALSADLRSLTAEARARLKEIRSGSKTLLSYTMPNPGLRDFAERCRKLALVTRSEAMREHLSALATDMERNAGKLERLKSGRHVNRDAC